MFSCLVHNLMECTSEYKPANNNAHLSDLGCVTVIFYTFSTTCTSCAVITVGLAKPFEIEVKSSEENMYISSLNSE